MEKDTITCDEAVTLAAHVEEPIQVQNNSQSFHIDYKMDRVGMSMC